jgi:hypothetical protein
VLPFLFVGVEEPLGVYVGIERFQQLPTNNAVIGASIVSNRCLSDFWWLLVDVINSAGIKDFVDASLGSW